MSHHSVMANSRIISFVVASRHPIVKEDAGQQKRCSTLLNMKHKFENLLISSYLRDFIMTTNYVFPLSFVLKKNERERVR